MTEPPLRQELSGVSEDAIYNFLTSYYLYQDELSWGRTQVLLAVEAGALTAAFAVRHLGGFVLLLAIVLVEPVAKPYRT